MNVGSLPTTDDRRIIHRLFRKAVRQDRSKRRGEAYSLLYVEPLSVARTQLADFINSLLVFLGSLASSRLTTKTVGQSPGAMNILRFRANDPD